MVERGWVRGIAAALACLGIALVVGVLGLAAVVPAGAEPSTPQDETASETTTPTETATLTESASPTESATPTETSSSSASTTPTSSASATLTESPTATAAPVAVDDAVLRWGVNNESNNRAFAPSTFNFFSAGLLPDPGRGGVTIKQSQWKQHVGPVRIEKWDGSGWKPATWAGLSTDSAGAPLGSPTAGTFSNHSIVFDGGTGTVDVAAGTAQVTWDGDVTVLYYSGMSFFYLSDPVLEVAGGSGELTGTLRGYRSSQTDPDVWEPVSPRQVTVATLPDVDLSDVRGFVATPAYSGVLVTGVPQVTTGPAVGAFPQSWVAYLDQLGAAAFWYSSGASTDAFKVALPLTVSYDAAHLVEPPAPAPEPSQDEPEIDNPGVTPPPPDASAPVAARALLPPGAQLPAAAPGVATEAPAATLARPVTQLRLTSVTSESSVSHRPSRLWWLVGALLLGAALVVRLTPDRMPERDASASP